jgi:hypothetical protein
VSYQYAALGNTIASETKVADLGMHGFDGLARRGSVVISLKQPFRCSWLPHLKVRQVNINQTIK